MIQPSSHKSETAGFALTSFHTDEVEVDMPQLRSGNQGAKVTVVIGPNGSGKSRALASIANEFEILWQLREGREPEKHVRNLRAWANHVSSAEVEFTQSGLHVRVERRHEEVLAWVDGERRPLEDIPFPSRMLAVAHLPWDRFRFEAADGGDNFYHYLGLRQATNLTTTGALETHVIGSVIRAYRQDFFQSSMPNWLSLMTLDRNMWISLRLRISDFALLDAENFDDLMAELRHREAKRRGSVRPPSTEAEFESESLVLYPFFQFLKQRAAATPVDKKRLIRFSPGLEDWSGSNEEFLTALNLAKRKLLISEVSLQLSRGEQILPFAQLSSGEQQILGTVSRILSELRPNSVVMIDEPEVSLHPNWQMRFIPMLLESLPTDVPCHIILATHSHFMVSDVSDDGMALMVSNVGSKVLEDFDGEVYGRSPENILYRAFGMGTVGNIYVETDLLNALQMVSGVKETDIARLSKIYNRLKVLEAEDNQAFSLILTGIRKKLQAVS